MLALAVAVVAFAVVVWAVRAQQRHAGDVVAVLGGLVGQRARFGISNEATTMGLVAPFVGVIASVDRVKQWVNFDWIEADPDEDTMVSAYMGNLSQTVVAECGVLVHLIRWVEQDGRDRKRLS